MGLAFQNQVKKKKLMCLEESKYIEDNEKH